MLEGLERFVAHQYPEAQGAIRLSLSVLWETPADALIFAAAGSDRQISHAPAWRSSRPRPPLLYRRHDSFYSQELLVICTRSRWQNQLDFLQGGVAGVHFLLLEYRSRLQISEFRNMIPCSCPSTHNEDSVFQLLYI